MRRPRQVFLALLIALLAASLPTAVALAQLPQFPNTFYGDVTTADGQLAPEGVVVTAVVDRGVSGSERRYSLDIVEPGKYGAPNGLQLKVGGVQDEQGPIADGSTIQFFLSVGTLPEDITGLQPVAEVPFFDDGNPHVTPLHLVGAILDSTGTPTPTPPLTPAPGPTATTTPRDDDNDGDSPTLIPTATPQPATPTSPSEGGGGGQPTPTATPFLVPTAEPLEPTPVVVVVAPPQVPTPTLEPIPTQQTPTVVAPTPTVSLEIDESISGGGGDDGGFPWWGWVLVVLGAGAATAGAALYYLRT